MSTEQTTTAQITTAQTTVSETVQSTEASTVPVETTEAAAEATTEATTAAPAETTAPVETTTATSELVSVPADPTQKDSYTVLFIGNSYTYTNNMPAAIFKKFAEAAGYKLEVYSITNGGYRLSQFEDPKDTYGARVESALKGTKEYDFIILQEQSIRPATDDTSVLFYDSVRNLSERIRAIGAQPVLYSTWGRKEGSDTLTSYKWTHEEMSWRLAAGYQAIGDELEIPVAHVGLAWLDITTNHPEIELYNADKSHPVYAGSYLAATTLFARIFNVDPTTVSYNGTLSAEVAGTLREAARKAVFETPEIPEDYQRTSEGVTMKK